MAEESNKELEDWVNMFCDFDSFCDEETKRLEESGLMYGIIYDNDFSDYALSYSWASFEPKKEDLKEGDVITFSKDGDAFDVLETKTSHNMRLFAGLFGYSALI